MSDFKRKIEIVESTTPPPNKYNWWFDLNTYELKRWTEGKWVKYDTKPVRPINMPAKDEIWFLLESNDFTEDELYDFIIGSFLDSMTYESYEITSDNVLKIKMSNDITSLTGGESFSSSVGLDGNARILAIKFPQLSTVGNDMESVVSSSRIDVIISNIDSIQNHALQCRSVICLSDTPPSIKYNAFKDDMGEGDISIYVKDSLVDVYKNATNWSEYNIQALSELDESVYNWG